MSSDPSRPVPAAPLAAVRARSPGWRDPRLWIGVAIVAVSVVLGARVLASADDTVAVWTVATDVGAGDTLGRSDLVSTRLRFAEASDLDRYYTAEDTLPADLTLSRSLGAGELLARAAVGSADDAETVDVSVEVSPGLVPPQVGVGSVVSVYLVAAPPADGATPSGSDAGGGRSATRDDSDAGTPALAGVTVTDAPALSQVAPGGARQLVLAVASEEVASYYRRLGALDNPLISVTLDR